MVENINHAEDEGDFLYVMNERGERVLVRSLEANQRVYLRFSNRTLRPVDIWWRDYRGFKRFYVKLESGRYYDINSFITHPWEFTDSHTKEQYVVNKQFVFLPPERIGGMDYRTNWNITVPKVRTLRNTALFTLGHVYRDAYNVDGLGLPMTLAEELQELITSMQRPTRAQAQHE